MHAWRIAAVGETPRCRGQFRTIDRRDTPPGHFLVSPVASRARASKLLAHLEAFLPAVW